MLSYFETVAVGDAEIRLAIHAGSGTVANIGRVGRVTLALVDAGIAYYVRGRAMVVAPPLASTPWNARVHVSVTGVSVDEADPLREGAAVIETGIRYRPAEPEARLEQARALLAELRASTIRA
jgi:hypothetical protein